MAQKFRLKFLGNIYELKGDDPEIDLQEAASYVEQKASELEEKYPSLPPSRLVVLIAMALARDYLTAKKRLDKLEQGLNIKLRQLGEKIDTRLVKKKD